MRQFLPFDIDAFSSPEIFDTLLTWLETFDAFGYTTASHTPDAPRFRFTLHLNRLISREEGSLLGLAIEKLFFTQFGEGSVTFDKSVYRNEQPSYTPLVGADFYRFKGGRVDVDAILTTFPTPLPTVDLHLKSDIAYEKIPCAVYLRPLIRAALFSINADDRALWVAMGHALKSIGETWARDLWLEWSKTSFKHDNDADLETWNSFFPVRTSFMAVISRAKLSHWLEDFSLTPNLTFREAIEYCRHFDFVDYELIREAIAKHLKVRVSVLDNAVAAATKINTHADNNDDQNSLFEDIVIWPDTVDGTDLLDDIRSLIDQHIVCDEHVKNAVTLWIAFTWFVHDVHVAPLAVITSPEKRCGKSQLLMLIGKLACRPLLASNISPAAVFRVIEAHRPTLIIDEADSFMDDNNNELRGIINSGHSRGTAFVIRSVGDDHDPKVFRTYGAKAIAGIGKRADTIMDRAIELPLRRKLDHETVALLRHTPETAFTTTVQKLARFHQDNHIAVAAARPTLPNELNSRAQDNWETLIAIAALAGPEWLARAQAAAIYLSTQDDPVVSTSIELLQDIRDAFRSTNSHEFPTQDLISKLTDDEEKPWRSFNKGMVITPRQLSNLLKPFGVSSRDMKFSGSTRKGYSVKMFGDAFTRYLESADLDLDAATQPYNEFNHLPVADDLMVAQPYPVSATNNSLINNESCSQAYNSRLEDKETNADIKMTIVSEELS